MFWRKCIIIVLTGASIVSLRGGGVAVALTPIPIYVFAGQSNMVGANAKTAELATVAPELLEAQGDVLFWGPTTDTPVRWMPLRPPTEVIQSSFLNGFGPELMAARALSATRPDQTIGIFKFARNGSNLFRQWDPDEPRGLFQQMLANLKVARTELARRTGRRSYVAGFFWAQGEADANDYHHADAYGRHLNRLIDGFRTYAANPQLPVVIAQSLDVGKWQPSVPYSGYVRRKQFQVAVLDPHAVLVNADDLPQDPAFRGHLDTTGIIRLGERMAKRVAEIT